jgi:hypothetical protein
MSPCRMTDESCGVACVAGVSVVAWPEFAPELAPVGGQAGSATVTIADPMNSVDRQPQSSTPAPPERRGTPRYTVNVQIELRADGADIPLRAETTDLSRGGCYVQMMTTLPIGTYAKGTLWLDGTAVRIRGRVVTRHPQYGNGIIFIAFEGDGEVFLGRYLERISFADGERA